MHFLSNTPQGEDLFAGKSQEKIADIITTILDKDDFQIIGIDGSWGTGKSNLVKILEKKLQQQHFFIYDVWGHQEDDQRKAILVELTEFIAGRNIISDKEKWNNKLKKLLAREKEVTTINRPSLSIGFILSLILIVYVPTINTFVKDMSSTFWKLILILIPVIAIAGIYLSKLFYQYKLTNNLKEAFGIALQETFQIYSNKQIDETKTETIFENEPSVKDFRDWMKEIDNDLQGNQLILVFDNFDRLPKKHIVSIWSSIHIFFSEEKYSNIKVIVPFDRLHIKNAFKDLNGDGLLGNNDYANDYINKTFDLVYRVSPPILSDWTAYFRSCWEKAFENISEPEFLKVMQIYDVYKKSITPREIIAFINEIISIKLLYEDIPDDYVALFVLNQEAILQNPLKAITEADFLGGLCYLYIEDENFQKYITAMAYQVPADNALEVVYRKQLKSSLIHNDVQTFTNISKTEVFSKFIFLVLQEIEEVENPILVFQTLTEEAKISDIEKQLIWDAIYLKIKDVPIEEPILKDYQIILLRNISDEHKKKWLKYMIVSFRSIAGDASSAFIDIESRLVNSIFDLPEMVKYIRSLY